MNTFLQIDPEHTGIYYSVFYMLAFAAGFVLLMIEGRRRNFPTIPWMLVVATAFLSFIVGCRLITFSSGEWAYVLRMQKIPYTTARSVLGGLLLCIPGIWLAKKCLRLNAETMDAFAVVVPLGLFIQRFGCLLAGCCFGTPSGLPWAIQYSSHSHAFAQQVNDGLLLTGADHALPVHPVQLYDGLCCLAIILVIFRFRRLVKAPGNLSLISVGLYAVVRFFLEFVRAGRGHAVGGHVILGLSTVQWAILIALPLLFLLVRHREKTCSAFGKTLHDKPDFFRPAAYFLSLILAFLLASRWLNPVEIICFNFVLVPMLGILVWYLFEWTTLPQYRLASLALPLFALLFMNQTLPEQSKSDSTRLSYTTVSFGFLGGSSGASGTSTDCNGNPYGSANYNYNYSAEALGVSRTVQLDRKQILSFGVNGFVGKNRETYQINEPPASSHGDMTFNYYAVKPYVQSDWKRIGIGVGLNIGRFNTINYPSDLFQAPSSSTTVPLKVYPAVSLRIGNLSKVFFEYKLANQFPSCYPSLQSQVDVGFGFGQRNGAKLRIGTGSYAGLFIAPSIPAGKNILIEPYLGGLAGLGGNGNKNNFVGSLSLHYAFNKKEK
jgi:prolipoprotein diacylglyceryltransferase